MIKTLCATMALASALTAFAAPSHADNYWQEHSYNVANVPPNDGLFVRKSPSRSAPRADGSRWLQNGDVVLIICQTWGESVNGNPMWDQLSDHFWISDYYTTTPSRNGPSAGIPAC